MTNYEKSGGGAKLIEYIADGVLPSGQVEQILSNELTVVTPDGELLSATHGKDARAEEMDEAIKNLEAAA